MAVWCPFIGEVKQQQHNKMRTCLVLWETKVTVLNLAQLAAVIPRMMYFGFAFVGSLWLFTSHQAMCLCWSTIRIAFAKMPNWFLHFTVKILICYASDSSYVQLRKVAAAAEAAETCWFIGISVFNQLMMYAKLLMTVLLGLFMYAIWFKQLLLKLIVLHKTQSESFRSWSNREARNSFNIDMNFLLFWLHIFEFRTIIIINHQLYLKSYEHADANSYADAMCNMISGVFFPIIQGMLCATWSVGVFWTKHTAVTKHNKIYSVVHNSILQIQRQVGWNILKVWNLDIFIFH